MSDESVLLGRLSEEFTERLRAGERPDIEDYARRHPVLAAWIRRIFPALLALEGVAAGEAPPGRATSGLRPGPLFGRYRIEREVGRGGMGVVYEATHLALGKRVALKLLPPLSRHEGNVERFFREARTAAALHHTNIVPVFDVGEVDGVPYYAMEYIAGRGLDRALGEMPPGEPASSSSRAAPFRLIAELGAQAADALEHAHRRGVIHRDVKPSNLILDERGTLWVTDFGLARRLDDPALTQSGALLGTPRYMSPEQVQASRRAVDHRTDIYSLGATLYECLARRPVHEGTTPEEVVHQILHREPAAPRRLDPAVPRDLETVVLKAMSKRPGDRYATAAELAEDLRRFLRREPVRARAAGLPVRLRRWVQRNPVLAAAEATVVVALAAGLTASLVLLRSARVQRARAEANFEKALGAVQEMLTEVGGNRLAPMPHMERVRRELLAKALRFYEGFLDERGDDPAVRRETARAAGRAAGIQFSLGEHAAAERNYRGAIALLSAPGAPPEGRADLALCHRGLGRVLGFQGRMVEAEAAYREALRLWEDLARDLPSLPAPRAERATAMTGLGQVVEETGRATEAVAIYRDARALIEGLDDASRRRPEVRSIEAEALSRLAGLLLQANRLREAEDAHRAALSCREEMNRRFPDRPDHRFELAKSHDGLGLLLASDHRAEEAEGAFRKALGLVRPLAADFPAVPEFRHLQANVLNNLGNLLRDLRRGEEAKELYEQALPLQERLAAEFPDVPDYRSQVASTLNNLGNLLRRSRPEEARALLDRAVRDQRAALESNPKNPVYRRFLSSHYWNLILTLVQLRDHAGATLAAGQLSGTFPDQAEEAWKAARCFSRCVLLAEEDSALAEEERRRRAEEYADRAMELLEAAVRCGWRDAEALRSLRDLDPIRGREDFRKLAGELGRARGPR